ncbi:hypothetical protein MOKP38_45370 [Mycobacterium avium subsp. hominissuis]
MPRVWFRRADFGQCCAVLEQRDVEAVVDVAELAIDPPNICEQVVSESLALLDNRRVGSNGA